MLVSSFGGIKQHPNVIKPNEASLSQPYMSLKEAATITVHTVDHWLSEPQWSLAMVKYTEFFWITEHTKSEIL